MTRLAYAMAKLKITEKTLADLLHVDKSLVNRWKNRQRPFTSTHPQFNKAVESIAKIYDKSSADLKRAFLSQLPSSHFNSTIELMHWFFTSSDNSSASLEISDLSQNLAQTYVFSNCNEMDVVLEKFFDLLSLETGGKLRLMVSDFALCAPSCDAQEMLKTSLSALLARNVKVECLLKSDEKEISKNPDVFMFLSEMAFDSRFKFFFLKSAAFDSIGNNLFVYEDKVALTIKRAHNTEAPVLIELFTDQPRCAFFSSYFRQTLKKWPLFYTHINSVSSREILSVLKSNANYTSTAYCYSTYPYYLYLTDGLLSKIFDYNKISGAEKSRAIFEYKQMVTKNTGLIRQIYCTSDLDSGLSGSNFELPIFTLVTGKHVYASRKLMSEVLKEWLVTLAESRHHEIMLTPRSLMACGSGFNCFVKEFYFAGFWRDNEILSSSQYTTQSYGIHMLMSIFDKEWECNENTMKDKNRIIEHFKSIIRQLD